jgi:hypothetical protein
VRKIAFAATMAAVVTLSACQKTGEGEYKVKTPDVDVNTSVDTTTVRTPSVDVGTKQDTVVVKTPTVDVKTPAERKNP